MKNRAYTVNYSKAELAEIALNDAKYARDRAKRRLDAELAHGRACADPALLSQYCVWLEEAEHAVHTCYASVQAKG